MKTTLNTVGTLFLALTFAFTACKKKDDAAPEEQTPATTPTATTNNSSAPNVSIPSDANGALITLKLNTQISQSVPGFTMVINYLTSIDNATAVFNSNGLPTGTATATYENAGTVTVNSNSLGINSNNTYYKNQTPPATTFLNYSGNMWSVSGATGLPAISGSSSPAIPSYDTTYFMDNLLVNKTITKANGLSIPLSSKLSGSCDSVYVQIVDGGSGKFLKAYASTLSTITISAAQLSGLSNTSNAQFLIAPYKITSVVPQTGKKYYFVSEQANVKTGITIN